MVGHLNADQIGRYRDGRMTREEQLETDKHLAACGECRSTVFSPVGEGGQFHRAVHDEADPMHEAGFQHDHGRQEGILENSAAEPRRSMGQRHGAWDDERAADVTDRNTSHPQRQGTGEAGAEEPRAVPDKPRSLAEWMAADLAASTPYRTPWWQRRGVLSSAATVGAGMALLAFLFLSGGEPRVMSPLPSSAHSSVPNEGTGWTEPVPQREPPPNVRPRAVSPRAVEPRPTEPRLESQPLRPRDAAGMPGPAPQPVRNGHPAAMSPRSAASLSGGTGRKELRAAGAPTPRETASSVPGKGASPRRPGLAAARVAARAKSVARARLSGRKTFQGRGPSSNPATVMLASLDRTCSAALQGMASYDTGGLGAEAIDKGNGAAQDTQDFGPRQPVSTRIVATDPAFWIYCKDPQDTYMVHIKPDTGPEIVVSLAPVSGAGSLIEFQLSRFGRRLRRGMQYEWWVETPSGNLKSSAARFGVLSPKEVRALDADLSRITGRWGNSPQAHLARLQVYTKWRLYDAFAEELRNPRLVNIPGAATMLASFADRREHSLNTSAH